MFKRSEVTYLKYVAENCNNNKKEIINRKNAKESWFKLEIII